MTTNERGDMTDHLLERLEHQEGMLRRDPSRHYLHAADTMRDARAEVVRLREALTEIREFAAVTPDDRVGCMGGCGGFRTPLSTRRPLERRYRDD